ncbi:MAG: YigZ family protein [Caldilineaceae bacterium]|nr:YigZ family protein [Caldilineaceae bacterium]
MTPAARYLIPAQTYRTEEEILRSRFITTVGYTPTVEAAREFIASVSREFADASHNCWAYVVGSPGSTGQVGMGDDGEPHGTAGRPMLTVLLHSKVGDVCAVVTRYFGGTLLGKGGLVKAYTGGVQLALETLPVCEQVPKATITLLFDYSYITPIQRLFPLFEVTLRGEQYAADVFYELTLPLEQVPPFTVAVMELTNGQAIVESSAADAANDTV